MDASTLAIVERIVQTVLPLAAVVSIGFFYARRHQPDMEAVNRINIDVFVPALIFSVLATGPLDLARYAQLALGGALVVAGSAVFAVPLCCMLRVEPRTLLPPIMFRNSGNLGLPLAVLAFGEQALPAAVVLFIVTNVLHFTLGVFLLDRHTHPLALLKMPMILASIVGLLWRGFELPMPQAMATSVKLLGQVSIPLMLFALGVRMTKIDFTAWRVGLAGAALCPLLGVALTLLIAPLLALDEAQLRSLLLYSALPPAVMNFILAERYAQEPDRVAAIVLMGNLASLLFIPSVLFLILSR